MARRRTKDLIFEESLFNNMEDFLNLRNRLISLCVGRFNLEGLPNYIYKPYVYRLMLGSLDKIIAYDSDLDRYFIYPYTSEGRLNEYNLPTQRRITCANNGYTRVFDETNSVIFRTSMSGTPLLPIIEEYARKLYIVSRTIDLNVHAQKFPVVVLCDEDQELTFKNLMKQYEGNVPFIFGDKGVMNMENVKALNLGVPFVADKLQMLKTDIWNEFLTFIGVSNVAINKKERLITDEVNRSLGGVLTARNDFVRAIKDSLDEANELFGTNWKFHFVEDGDEDSSEPGEESEEKEETIIEERGEI